MPTSESEGGSQHMREMMRNQREMDRQIHGMQNKNKHHDVNNYGAEQFQPDVYNPPGEQGPPGQGKAGEVALYHRTRSPTYLTCKPSPLSICHQTSLPALYQTDQGARWCVITKTITMIDVWKDEDDFEWLFYIKYNILDLWWNTLTSIHFHNIPANPNEEKSTTI